MSCSNGNHKLIEVARMPRSMDIEDVIRWCETCGSVVGDVDFDGRTHPGRLFKMINPAQAKVYKPIPRSPYEPVGAKGLKL